MVPTFPRRLARLCLPYLGLLLPCGCLIAPKAQLDECRQRGQALRAENDRLKDQVLALRSRTQDVAERSVDDERRLKAQDEAIDRLEQTVQAYQDDRERLASAFDRLKAQIEASAGPEAARGSNESPESVDHAVSLQVDLLFLPGSAQFRPAADDRLKDLSATLAAAQRAGREVVVVAPPDDVSVVQAGNDPSVDHAARARFLAMARANRLRARLAESASLGADRIRVADPDRAANGDALEIRLVRADAAPGPSGP